MAFTQDQVNQAYRDSLAQGFSAADIAKGASNLGIDPYMLQLAATASAPAPAGIPQGPNPAYASGYGGYQPEGSKYYGDNPMPEEYMKQLPQLDKSTGNAVNLALQQAMDAARKNGYDPETLNSVQKLRGYFSDDPQLRANAMQQASSMLGGGLTLDYGHGGIRGYEGMETTTPTFSTAFNKDWERPTLYDMINSSVGWESGANNYADPASRDAALNRKLSDAEIAAFQKGNLPAGLASTVNAYRTGAAGGGGQGGQGVGGQGMSGGTARQPMSSVNLQGYQKNPYLDDMAAGIRRQVTQNLTEGILPGLRSNAIAAGGFGGSRQGVAEGLAIGRTNEGLSTALANLYGNDYQAQMNRNLQKYGIDNQTSLGWASNALGNKQADNSYSLGLGNLALGNKQADNSYALGNKQADNSYALGMGNLGLGYANLDRSINNDNNSWALQGANLLNSTWNQLNSNNAGAIGAGGNIQNTPINYWQQFGNQANAFGQGYGTSTQNGGGGNPLLGAAGGWQLGGQLGKMFGGNSGYTPDAMGQGMANNQSWYNAQIGF